MPQQRLNFQSALTRYAQWGLVPHKSEIIQLVADYIRENELNIRAFKSGKPGPDCFHGFTKRNKLSLKKANMISAARKSCTGNPFIVYDFYEQLSNIISSKKLQAHQIWNCDESRFPNDPHKCKVVSVKGKTAYKITCGARRENISTLAVVNAAGRVLSHLIIFGGKNMQSTWRGSNALPGTLYGISENGWMTSEVFSEWFHQFCDLVTERLLLLILDGHF